MSVFQSEKIITITNAAGVDLEPIWASLLAKALEGKDVKELLSNVGSGGGAPAAGAPAAAGGAAPAAEAPAEEKKEEEKEESDDDMVGILCILYACQALMYTYVASNRALVSSIDLQAAVLTCIVLTFPSRCIFPLHNTHK